MAEILRDEAELDSVDVQKVLGTLWGVGDISEEWWEVTTFPFDLWALSLHKIDVGNGPCSVTGGEKRADKGCSKIIVKRLCPRKIWGFNWPEFPYLLGEKTAIEFPFFIPLIFSWKLNY